MTLIAPVLLDGNSLDLDSLEEIARGRPAALDPAVLPAVRASRKVVDDLLSRGEVAYGLNTGFRPSGQPEDRARPGPRAATQPDSQPL